MTTMASSYFTISPTGGTGDGVITVTPTGNNMTINDRVATVSVCGQTVTVTHWGIPSIQRLYGQEPVLAPASGDTYQFRVKTHYQVQFCNKPDWVVIDDGAGNTITSAQTIEANVANNHTYNFTVLPNTSNNSRQAPANFGLWHKMGGVLQQVYDEVEISQDAGAEDYIVITPLTLDWDSTTAHSLSIEANVPYTVSNSNTTDFTLGGTSGAETIKANASNSGTTKKTTTVTVTSTKSGFNFSTSATITQLREPRINIIGSALNIPWSGGVEYAEVTSDYYWWLRPTVRPDSNAYYEYITMAGKTQDTNLTPTAATYTLTWDENTGYERRGYIGVGYLKNNGTTASSHTSFEFSQKSQASTTFEVTPVRIPETGFVSSGGGVYTLNVVTERPWLCESTHRWCTVSPTQGTGNTNVTVTVPPASAEGSSHKIVDGLSFSTNDAEMGADQTVYVYQYDRYVEPPYVVADPDDFDISSATSSYAYTVSSNTNWYVYLVDEEGYPTIEWIDMTTTGGTSGYTTGLHFDVATNFTNSARTAVLQFTTGSPTVYATITINQVAGAPVGNFFTVTTTPSTGITFNSGSSGSIGKYLTVSASTDWNVTSKPNWLTLGTSPFVGTITSGTSGSTNIYPRPAENSGSSRSGYVILTSVAGLSGMSALITQASGYTPVQDYIIVNTNPATGITYTSAGTESTLDTAKYIQISASTNFVISSKPSWLELSTSALHPSPSQGGGVGNNKFYPIVAANSGSSRSGYVTFSGGGMTGTSALISQDEAYTPSQYDDLYVEPEDSSSVLMNIPATGGAYSFYFENDGADAVAWEINFDNDEWGQFYDGPNPEQSDAVNMIEAGSIGYIWLYVDGTASSRNNTITFYPSEGAGTLTQKTFYIHQNS